MTSAPEPSFRDRLATLDRETATTFVAAVYDARGWTVTRDDDELLATPPRSDRTRRLVVAVGSAADGDGGVTDGDGGTVVDAERLHELVAYALPPDERTRLCQRFVDREPAPFGGCDDDPDDGDAASAGRDRGGDDGSTTRTRRDPESNPPPAPRERGVDADERVSDRVVENDADRRGTLARPEDDGLDWVDGGGPDRSEDDGSERSEWIGRVAVIGLVFSLALGGIVTATGPGGVDVGSAAAVFGGNDTAGESPSTRALPRGVEETGVTDAASLAAAHEATLSNRSYRLTITYREFENGELRGVAHERALVASPNRYRSRVRRLGSVRHESTLIASGPTYANGSTGYVQTADGVRERTEIRSALVPASTDSVGFLDRTERTVQWYLSVNDSRIVGVTDHNGTAVFRIAFEGDPWPDSRDVTGWARVDENGLVRELHREYTPTLEPDVRIEVSVRIESGPVTVTRPEWLSSTGINGSYERRAPVLAEPADNDNPDARPNV